MTLPPRAIVIICILFIAGPFICPAFVLAATGTLRVNQPIGTVVPPDDGGGVGSSSQPAQISNVAAKLSFNSATISWNTSKLTLGKLVWGRSQDYRDGVITKEQFSQTQSTLLTDLLPITKYFFQITAVDLNGAQTFYTGEFNTLSTPDITPPLNVTAFVASPRTDRIVLSWINSPDPDFQSVRVVRSDKFFPLDPSNGEVIYEGSANNFEDINITPGIVYYYSIFARDHSGNYSSGSLSSTMILWYSEQPAAGTPNTPPNTTVDAPVVDLQFPKSEVVPNHPAVLKNFIFTYNHGAATIDLINGTVPANTPFQIDVDQAQLPEEAAYITISIRNNNKQTPESLYLFQYDSAAKSYSLIVPSYPEGNYDFTLTIFSSARFVLQEINGNFKVSHETATSNSESQKGTAFKVSSKLIAAIASGIGLLILIVLAIIYIL